MTTLVTGSRGRVGRTLTGLLRANGHDVRAASSTPDATSVRCALDDPDTFPAALKGVTSVFLYAQASHIDAFIEEATAAGVRHIVLLSTATVIEPAAATNPIARLHIPVEEALTASPIATTILRPGSFAANALRWPSGTVSLPYPDAHTDPIHELDIAEAALKVLEESRPGAYTLTGPESLSFREQIDRLARVTGRTITVDAVTREAWKAEMSAHMPGPFADALLDMWQAADGIPVPITDTVEELTGHPARSFTEWAEDHAEALKR
jgi:uncharacterized protein YbjT (DUF2867 family)